MFQIIKQDILNFFYLYFKQGSKIAILFFFITLIIGSYCIRRHEKRVVNYWFLFFKSLNIALLIFYIYIVLEITLLSRNRHSEVYVNLQLFSTFDNTMVDPKYLYENFIMLIPFAILLYLLAKPFRNMSISLLVGFFCSLAIEIVQMVTRLGQFVVDDIWTNTLGMFIGFTICRLVSMIWGVMKKQKYGKLVKKAKMDRNRRLI